MNRWLELAVIVALAWVSTEAARADGPYPVWWSPTLELDSLDAIDQRLNQQVLPGEPLEYAQWDLYKTTNGDEVKVTATTCVEFMTFRSRVTTLVRPMHPSRRTGKATAARSRCSSRQSRPREATFATSCWTPTP